MVTTMKRDFKDDNKEREGRKIRDNEDDVGEAEDGEEK